MASLIDFDSAEDVFLPNIFLLVCVSVSVNMKDFTYLNDRINEA